MEAYFIDNIAVDPARQGLGLGRQLMEYAVARGDDDVDAKRSRPSIGKPASGHARKERVVLIGTDQRITSGPAARTAAIRGRIHDCTRIVSRKGQILFPCTAGAVHGPEVPSGALYDCYRMRSGRPFR